MKNENTKSKEIRTPELSVAGNVMSWRDTIIQLSNISSLSTVPLELAAFPYWTIIVILVGIFLLQESMAISFVAFGVAAVVIYLWYEKNLELKNQRNLVIMMNSGIVFVICFADKGFLQKVYGVLSTIIAEGNTASKHIKIDINNSVISGEARILNDLIL